MISNLRQQKNAAVTDRGPGERMRLQSIALACLLSSTMLLVACKTTATRPSDGASGNGGADTGIESADTAYYFDATRKLVAVEVLSDEARTIKRSVEFANQDGANLIFDSTCQDSLPVFEGETEMIGKASLAVYAISKPESLVVLGVEDLQDVSSRKIVPLKKIGNGGACCCALKRCGPVKCCPCAGGC